MRACIQRVSEADVTVAGEVTGRIGRGMLVLLGVGTADGAAEVEWLAEKLVNLRIFEDGKGKMNRSLVDAGGAMLVVSQFTLFGERGRAAGRASPRRRRRSWPSNCTTSLSRGCSSSGSSWRPVCSGPTWTCGW